MVSQNQWTTLRGARQKHSSQALPQILCLKYGQMQVGNHPRGLLSLKFMASDFPSFQVSLSSQWL